jgi:hypothetical protein
LQPLWMAGVRLAMKALFLHTQAMSVAWQPVEPMAWMAGVTFISSR